MKDLWIPISIGFIFALTGAMVICVSVIQANQDLIMGLGGCIMGTGLVIAGTILVVIGFNISKDNKSKIDAN
jgi:hypothetical protein